MGNNRDCEHGRRKGDCIYCEQLELLEENRKLAAIITVLKQHLADTEKRLDLAAAERDHYKSLVAEFEEELNFFLEQSIIIEHRQDHDKMRKLRKKYGYDF